LRQHLTPCKSSNTKEYKDGGNQKEDAGHEGGEGQCM